MKQRKTIWIIDHYSSEPQYGGISRQYDFAKELDRRGYNVIIFASGFSHYTHSYISEKEIFLSKASKHVRYVYVKTTFYNENNGKDRALNMVSFLMQVLRHEKAVAKRYGKPDVVEGASVHPLAWIAAYRIAKKYKVRFVAEVRDFWPQMWIDSGTKKASDPMCVFFRAIEDFAFRKAEHIICSPYHGDRYVCGERGVPKDKVSIIGQPMDCEEYDRNRERFEELPADIREFVSDGFVCMFAGYFMGYDCVNVMLEAQNILQENGISVKMIFVGSGEEEENMRRYVREHELKNVLISGRIPRTDVPALLSRADVCITQMDCKGKENVFRFGVSKLKINDYLYSGACTLFGFQFDDDEVVQSGGGIRFQPHDAHDLAEKITFLYQLEEEERKKYGERARVYMRKSHSVEMLTDRLLEALFQA